MVPPPHLSVDWALHVISRSSQTLAMSTLWIQRLLMAPMKTLFRHDAVIVRWLDAHCRNQAVEYTEDEARLQYHRGEEVTTLGLLLYEDDKGLSLYNENTGPDSIRGLNFIPKAMVIDVVRLGRLRTPRKTRVRPVSPSTAQTTVLAR